MLNLAASEVWFDAEGVEEELQGGTYLRVRPAGAIAELEARPGDRIHAR